MKNQIQIAVLLCLFLMSRSTLSAQTLNSLRKDMYGIACDATEGRFTGASGYFMAARYVVKQLKEMGLKPGWASKGRRTFLQPVPFIRDDYTGSRIRIGKVVYLHEGANFVVLKSEAAHSGDSRATADQTLKWLVLAAGDSLRGQAGGIVFLPNENQAKDWETTVIRQYRFGYMHYGPDGIPHQSGPPAVLLNPALAKGLKAGDSVDVTLLKREDARIGYNVIAYLPGSDPVLRKRLVVLSAHLDHIGRIGAHIYNGANDDASGCVAELYAARRLKKHMPRSSLLFTFFCGEELNLKGSRWFVDHFKARRISADINLEQLGSVHRSFRGIMALGDSRFKDSFYASGKMFSSENLGFFPTDSVREEMNNTDSFSFMNKNIPALLLGSGGFDEHHTTQDKINLIDFQHLKSAGDLIYNLTWKLADMR